MDDIHPQLQSDSESLGKFSLCHVRLSRDANYPWLILIPDRKGIREIFELSWNDQMQLMRESSHVARVLTHIFKPDKLNIATLGNIVSQLHMHHIVRYHNDVAWPAPVWGRVPARPYPPEEWYRQIECLRTHLKSDCGWTVD